MFVVSGCDPPELFEVSEKALDDVSFLVELCIDVPWLF